MNLKQKTTILILSLTLVSGYSIYNQIVVSKQLKNIKSLKSEVSTLENKNEELEDKIEELEESLAEVQHFDDDASVSNGFSAQRNGSVSFTGTVYETKIDGEFNGWEGETIFKMMDGSIWQQVSYDYTYHYAYMPDVIIYKKNGITYMKVEGVEDVIQVMRIR